MKPFKYAENLNFTYIKKFLLEKNIFMLLIQRIFHDNKFFTIFYNFLQLKLIDYNCSYI